MGYCLSLDASSQDMSRRMTCSQCTLPVGSRRRHPSPPPSTILLAVCCIDLLSYRHAYTPQQHLIPILRTDLPSHTVPCLTLPTIAVLWQTASQRRRLLQRIRFRAPLHPTLHLTQLELRVPTHLLRLCRHSRSSQAYLCASVPENTARANATAACAFARFVVGFLPNIRDDAFSSEPHMRSITMNDAKM